MDLSAIEVKNLVKVYQRRGQQPARAVDDLSFTVRRGEIFGLLGPNGAGKTTTLKILTTLAQPTSGSAAILGFDVVHEPLEVRRNILVVMQENAVELYLSVTDNLRTFGRFHYLTRKEIGRRADEVIELFGLQEFRTRKAIDLSGGMKRRVQVAKVFMVDSPIVFLDEATTGMDTLNKRRTIEALMEQARRGRTIVLTTHVLDEAEELCDSIVIINHGRAIASGSPETVKALSLRLYTLTMSFDNIGEDLLSLLRSFDSVGMEVTNSTAIITLREESAIIPIVTQAHQHQALRHFEVSSATLEDAFIHLIDQQDEAGS